MYLDDGSSVSFLLVSLNDIKVNTISIFINFFSNQNLTTYVIKKYRSYLYTTCFHSKVL